MRFRGRELAHQELGMNVLMRVRDDLDKVAKIEQIAAHGRPADDHGDVAEVGRCRLLAFARRRGPFVALTCEARIKVGPRLCYAYLPIPCSAAINRASTGRLAHGHASPPKH